MTNYVAIYFDYLNSPQRSSKNKYVRKMFGKMDFLTQTDRVKIFLVKVQIYSPVIYYNFSTFPYKFH